MKNLTTILITALISVSLTSTAQELKFGKVSKQELQEKFYPQDSSAHAVILYKNRTSRYEYDDSEGFSILTKIHERIKIYDKDGIAWAKKEIDARKSDHLRGCKHKSLYF